VTTRSYPGPQFRGNPTPPRPNDCLRTEGVLDDLLIGAPQVHATLALAAATAMASDFGNRAEAEA
jgi:hypothetical protein